MKRVHVAEGAHCRCEPKRKSFPRQKDAEVALEALDTIASEKQGYWDTGLRRMYERGVSALKRLGA